VHITIRCLLNVTTTLASIAGHLYGTITYAATGQERESCVSDCK